MRGDRPKALSEALEHGLKTGEKYLLTIDSNSGEEVYSKVEGTDDQVVFPQSLVDFLRQAESNSIISINNHPNSSSFSDADLRVMVQFRSVGSMAVIGHNGTRYTVSVGQGVRPTGNEVQAEWKTAHDSHFSYFNRLVSSRALKPEDAWKEHTHLIIKDVAKKFGWDYRRVISDGK